MEAERQRTPNFTEYETQFLLELVQKQKIIECKKTDKITSELKSLAWKQIAFEFNRRSEASQFRSDKMLKKKYVNLKRDVKKRTGCLKRSLYRDDELEDEEPQTKIEPKDTDDDEEVESILPESEIPCIERSVCDNKSVEKPPASRRSNLTRLADLKVKWLEEKYEAEISLLKSEHQQRMFLMQEEFEMKRERHDLEMEILHYEFEQKKLRNSTT